MKIAVRFPVIVLAFAALAAAGGEKWKYAGENQGIAFHLRIAGECKEGSKVTIRLKSSLDHTVTVTFRLNDSDWRKTFTSRVSPSDDRGALLEFKPSDGTACNPYIDQVYVESQEPTVTQSGDDALPGL